MAKLIRCSNCGRPYKDILEACPYCNEPNAEAGLVQLQESEKATTQVPKSEPKPEPKPAPKQEPKAEPKQEPKAEPKPAPKQEPKAEPKPAPQPEPQPATKVEPKVEPKAEPTEVPQSKPEPQPAPADTNAKPQNEISEKAKPKKSKKGLYITLSIVALLVVGLGLFFLLKGKKLELNLPKDNMPSDKALVEKAINGDARSVAILSYYYCGDGDKVKKGDLQVSYRLAKISADMNDPLGYFMLGYCYDCGIPSPEKSDSAEYYFVKGYKALKDDPKKEDVTAYWYGTLSLNGLGDAIKANEAEGLKYLKLAAERGWESAKRNLEFYEQKKKWEAEQAEIRRQIEEQKAIGRDYLALSSWRTSVEYDNVKVVNSKGTTLYFTSFDDPSELGTHWRTTGGSWSISNGKLRQTDPTVDGHCCILDMPTTDCTIELDAARKSGEEGFVVSFCYNPNNFYWVNFGGWLNEMHGVQYCTSRNDVAQHNILERKYGSVATNRFYHIKIVRHDGVSDIYLDGTHWFTVNH